MSEFLKDDYKEMLLPVHTANMKIPFLEQFPDLKLFPEFSALLSLDRNKVIKYIALTYDKNSPYVKKYKDPAVRKTHSIVEAGFQLNKNGEVDPELEEMVSNENIIVVNMIVAYLKMHNDIGYSYLIMMESIYYSKLTEAIHRGSVTKFSELESIKKSYQEAQDTFLSGDNSKPVLKSLSKLMSIDKIDYSPEAIAKRKREGALVSFL